MTHISLLIYKYDAPALEGGALVPGNGDDVQLGEGEGEVGVALHVLQEGRNDLLQVSHLVQHLMPRPYWK